MSSGSLPLARYEGICDDCNPKVHEYWLNNRFKWAENLVGDMKEEFFSTLNEEQKKYLNRLVYRRTGVWIDKNLLGAK